ncbi:hypothetical protein LY28_00699 [Ruminiclostridium sufflavum DSM 19573]|uniref:SynChlorMet cassette protein ScmC n=1 Tax=Ruminiclostridium sufflavum DSM 19573 TaxID=1121337 RepID=A0A318XQ74_9FIRM|nr:hypothetical protein [Ruminiclostridium sufflavum]PYG89480.1 hypothetical protein LY28_00699 [Ruminiclostridium sufflavum DSM 19573]
MSYGSLKHAIRLYKTDAGSEKMFAYNVAGTNIHIETCNNYLTGRMKDFECNKHNNPDISAEIAQRSYIRRPKGRLLFSENLKWLKKERESDGFHIYCTDRKEKEVLFHMDTNMEWSNANIECLRQETDDEAPELVKIWPDMHTFMLMGIVFRNNLLYKNGIVMHASSIAWNGKGILFTAPSGTGKSTHVRLWERYMGAAVKVVNDDTPAVRFIGEEPVLCGTPWSGSSDKFINTEVPVRAIVVLSQASDNSILRLNAFEALPLVMPRCFLPYFDEKLMRKAYDVLENIIKKIPIYHLKCRPDKEAMELVYQCVR